MPAMTSAGVLGRRARSARRGSVKKATRNRPAVVTPIRIVSVSAAGAVVTVTFDQPVSLSGVPAYTTDVAGATATEAAMTSPTVMALTFSATVAAATELRIPFQEPAVRSPVGGFVADSTFPV